MTLNRLLSGDVQSKSNALSHSGEDSGWRWNTDFKMFHNFLVQSEDLASQYQQQIFHDVLFWVVLQFLKSSLPKTKKKKKKWLSYTTIKYFNRHFSIGPSN